MEASKDLLAVTHGFSLRRRSHNKGIRKKSRQRMFVSWLAAIEQGPASSKRFIYILTLFIDSGALETSQPQHKRGCRGGGVDAIIAPILDLLSRKHWLSMWRGLP